MESPDSFLETTKEIGGKASGVARQARLTKDVSLRNVDSMFPGNGAKMLSHGL